LAWRTTGKIDFQLDWALNLGFGINLADGFYFDIANKDGNGVKHPELEIKADVTVPDGGIKGTLGFLQLSAEDNPNGDATATHLGRDVRRRHHQSQTTPADEKLSFTSSVASASPRASRPEAVVDLGR
jgi:hypothetical protein